MTVKKALGLGLLGIPIGIAISTTIALAISLVAGSYSPVSPPDGRPDERSSFPVPGQRSPWLYLRIRVCHLGSGALESSEENAHPFSAADLYPAAHLHCLPLGSSQFYQHTDLFRGFRGALPDYLDCPVPDYPAQNFQNERPSL